MQMPKTGPFSSRFFCTDDATITRYDIADALISMPALRALESCGDAPVEGDVTGCVEPNSPSPSGLCGGKPTVHSSIDPAPFELTGVSSTYGAGSGWTTFFMNGDVVRIWVGASGVFRQAIIRVPSGPDAGALYCAQEASLKTMSNGSAIKKLEFVLGKLSRLGRCNEKTDVGSLEMCVMY